MFRFAKFYYTSQLCCKRFSQLHPNLEKLPLTINSLSKSSIPHTQAEFLQKMIFFNSAEQPNSKLLKIAVIGFPNAGKSSLVNMLSKWRVCAVSGKAHTTRSKQTVVFTKDNIQLAFVDLPGIVSLGQCKQLKLEKTFIRDPHAAIFDSDIILVVVDSSNMYARQSLDPEIIKALHFFKHKESILILNKVDASKNNRTRLLEVARRLSGGIVDGKSSQLNAYENRFLHRNQLASKNNYVAKISTQEEIFSRLPQEAHEAAEKRLSNLKHLRELLSPPIQIQAALLSKPTRKLKQLSPPGEAKQMAGLDKHQLTNKENIQHTVVQIQQGNVNSNDQTEKNHRLVTDIEMQTIDAYFLKFKPGNQLTCSSKEVDKFEVKEEIKTEKEVYLESIMEDLKQQLMLNSATEDEVLARKNEWRQLSQQLQGVYCWKGFTNIFMVSSATGEGIENLRNFLLEKAKPNKWILSSTLITDQEPSELIRMCIWAHCLDQLPQEVPYSLRFVVDDCEKVHLNDGDDRLYIHIRILCQKQRHLKKVLGVNGNMIKTLAGAVKQELMDMFQAPTVVKLTVEMAKLPRIVKKQFRKVTDVADVFPTYDEPKNDTVANSIEVE